MTNCHVCGASGKLWHKEPIVFQCTKCLSIYSEFGIVTDPQVEPQDNWS